MFWWCFLGWSTGVSCLSNDLSIAGVRDFFSTDASTTIYPIMSVPSSLRLLPATVKRSGGFLLFMCMLQLGVLRQIS
jgi:hypothetical protein